LTLFASEALEQYRAKRQWSVIYDKLKQYNFYPNAKQVLVQLRNQGIKVAIVTNAPQSYVSRALIYHGVSVDYLVAYHDVHRHKPDPEGIFKVINTFSLKHDEVVYVGDNDIDQRTASNANIAFIGIEWGNFSDRTIAKVNYLNLISYIQNN